MKNSRIAMASAACIAGAAGAQDAVQVAPAHYQVKVENEHVRVIENTLRPGEKDGMHTHPSGWYLVTRPGRMKVVFASGKVETWAPKAGESGWLKPEGPHTSENIGTTTLSFTLVEVKSAPATPPAQATASKQ